MDLTQFCQKFRSWDRVLERNLSQKSKGLHLPCPRLPPHFSLPLVHADCRPLHLHVSEHSKEQGITQWALLLFNEMEISGWVL